jgi:ABC-type molybdate transport system substrate-binding protein
VIAASDRAAAQDFLDFLSTDAAKAVFVAQGFTTLD